MLESKFVKLPMPILNWEVNSSSSFVSFFILMTHNSPVNFKLKYFQLWTKESHQSPHFETYKCSGENLPNSLCYFSNQKLVFLQILHHFLVSWKITPLHFFRSKITRKDQSKCKILGLLSARIKIHQILVIFETTNQFSLKICIFFIAITHNSLVNFKLIYFLLGIKVPHKSPNFESQLSSALAKICQIPHVTFQATSHFFFKFCIAL